jgi:hypothetical protein
MRMGGRIAWVLSLTLLVFTGVLGIHNGVTEWDPGHTLAQKSVSAGTFIYGVFGLITAYGLFRRRAWSIGTAIAWGIVVTYVPGAAVMTFSGGEDAVLSSAISASGVTALIAAGVIWTAISLTRGSAQPPSHSE